jgi:hypothetical protein
VDDAPPVGIGERPQELRSHPVGELLVEGSAAVPGEELADVPAGDAFGHDERHLALMGDVIDLDDVLVVEAGHSPRLLLEALAEGGYLGVAPVKRLERDGTPEDGVLRFVDDRHPAGAQRALYPVTSPQEGPDRGFQSLTTFDRACPRTQLYSPEGAPGKLAAVRA